MVFRGARSARLIGECSDGSPGSGQSDSSSKGEKLRRRDCRACDVRIMVEVCTAERSGTGKGGIRADLTKEEAEKLGGLRRMWIDVGYGVRK